MSARIHKIVRGALGLLAGGSFVGLSASGYVGGAETTAGIDGGTVRDVVTALLTAAAVLYPKLSRASVFWKSLTNNDAVDCAQSEIEELKQRVELLEAADVDNAPTTRRRRRKST